MALRLGQQRQLADAPCRDPPRSPRAAPGSVRARRSIVAASNRSVLYSQRRRSPAADSRTDSVRSNLASRVSRRQAARPRRPSSASAGAGRVLQREHHLEQRIAAQVARRVRAPRPASRRAGPGACRPPAPSRARAPAARESVGSPDRSDAQHQRVDEEPDQPLHLGAAAPGDRRADRDVRLAAVAGQQHLEGRQQRHEQRGAFAPAQRLERRGHRRRQIHREVRPLVARHRRARPVGGQLQRRGDPPAGAASRRAAPRAPRPAATRAARPRSPHTGSAAAGSAGSAPRDERGVDRRELAVEARPSTSRPTRCGARSRSSTCSSAASRSSSARNSGPVARSNGWRACASASACARASRCRRRQRTEIGQHAAPRAAPGRSPAPARRRAAPTRVRSDSWRATTAATLRASAAHVERTVQPQRRRHVVRAGARLQLVEKPQPLLRKRQRQIARRAAPAPTRRPRRPPRPPARCCAAAASADTVGDSKKPRSDSSTWQQPGEARDAPASPAASARPTRRSCRARPPAPRAAPRARPPRSPPRARRAAPRTQSAAASRPYCGAGRARRSSLPLG